MNQIGRYMRSHKKIFKKLDRFIINCRIRKKVSASAGRTNILLKHKIKQVSRENRSNNFFSLVKKMLAPDGHKYPKFKTYAAKSPNFGDRTE